MKEPLKEAIIIHGRVYELRPAETAPCVHCALEYLCSDYGYLEGIPLCGIHGGDNDMMQYVEVEPNKQKERRNEPTKRTDKGGLSLALCDTDKRGVVADGRPCAT